MIGQKINMKFDSLLENYGVYKSIKREFYPKNITFSPEFLENVKEEYIRQKEQLVENKGVLREHRNKFLKALNFHLRDIEHNLMSEMSQAEKLKKEVVLQNKSSKAIKKEQPKVLKRNISK